jgi:hypothetical protein
MQATDRLGHDLVRRAARVQHDGVERLLEGIELAVHEPDVEKVALPALHPLRGGNRVDLEIEEPDPRV